MRPSFLFSIWTLVMAALFCVTALPVSAATYYVSPNGNNNFSGTSTAQPLRTINEAVNKMSNGDTLNIRAGSYYEAVTFPQSNITIRSYDGKGKAIIDGNKSPGKKIERVSDGKTVSVDVFELPHATGTSDRLASETAITTDLYYALLNVTGDKVIVDGLTVLNSRGIGINLQKATNSWVVNCTVKYTYDAAIKVGAIGKIGNNTADNCVAMYGNYIRDTGLYGEWKNIAQVIQLKGSNNTVKNCIVAYGACAGIEGFKDIDSVVENNIVFGNLLTQIHFAWSKNAVIRNNLLYGTQRPNSTPNTITKAWNSKGYGTGIELMCELWYDNSDWDYGHVAYGNLIANTKLGMRIGWQYGKETTHAGNKIRNITLYNNTVIEPSRVETGNQLCHALAIMDDGHLGTGNIVRNNIFWQTSGEPAFGVSSSSKIAMGYNLWNKKPASGFQRSTDPTAGASYPTLNMANYFPKTSGWNSLSGDSLTGDEFNLLATAKYAIGTGTSTPTASADDTMLSFSKATSPETYSLALGSTVFDDIQITDIFALAAQSNYSNWEVGAVVYVPGGAVADDSDDDLETDQEIPAPVLTITSQN